MKFEIIKIGSHFQLNNLVDDRSILVTHGQLTTMFIKIGEVLEQDLQIEILPELYKKLEIDHYKRDF